MVTDRAVPIDCGLNRAGPITDPCCIGPGGLKSSKHGPTPCPNPTGFRVGSGRLVVSKANVTKLRSGPRPTSSCPCWGVLFSCSGRAVLSCRGRPDPQPSLPGMTHLYIFCYYSQVDRRCSPKPIRVSSSSSVPCICPICCSLSRC